MIYRLMLALSMAVAASLSAQEAEPNVILVKFRQEASPADISGVESRHGLIFRDEIKLFRIRSYRYEGELSPADKSSQVAAEPAVEIAEPNWARTLKSADPEYANQWYLKNTGQAVDGYTGPAGVDIRWEGARQRFVERAKIRVAVVDSGVAILHKDLIPSIHVKSAEVSGGYGNLVDNDGNELVDDVWGYDWYDLDGLPLDQNGHGTMVAGVIGATIGNGEGVAGITNSVEIRAYRVFNQFGRSGVPKFRVGSSYVSDILLAVGTAVDDGCKIINLSLGGPAYSSLEAAAYRDLANRGILAIVAAGNDAKDNDGASPAYPASYDSQAIISVAAQSRSGGLAGFSNWGRTSVDIAAPGTQIRAPDVNRVTVAQYDFAQGMSGWTSFRYPGTDYSYATWTTAGGYLWDRDPYQYSTYFPYTDTFVQSPVIAGGLRGGLRLEAVGAYDLADDIASVDLTSDGINWYAYQYLAGADQGELEMDISDYDYSNFRVRIRLMSDYSYQGGGIAVRALRITAVDDFDVDNPQYGYTQGTSFSAPIVAGVAAMVWAHRPELTAQQVRQVILDTARPIPALSGKVATGGMVDADAALQRADLVSGNVLPAVISQPSGGTYSAGSTATLSVSATQGLAVTYQWRRNGAAISGATSSTLTLSGLNASMAGSYDVVVTSKAGSVVSAAASIQLDTPLVLVSAPSSRLVRAGDAVELAVSATAGSTISYQWRHKGKDLAGATQPALSIPSAAAANAGDYTVALAAGAYSLVTPVAKLEVAAFVTDLPAAAVMLPGGKLSLAVKVTGVKPTYAWSKADALIPGATGAKLAVVSGAPGTTTNHKVLVSTPLGSLESRTCAVTTVVPALATWSASPALVIAGQPLRLEAVVEGTGPLALQWLKKGKPIVGATTATLEISSAAPGDAGAYSLRVSGPANTFVTPPRTIAVADVLINKSAAPTVLLAPGKTAKLAATVVGFKGAALQWSKDGSPLVGQTAATLTVSSPGRYEVTMTTPSGQKVAAATVIGTP